MSRVPTISLIGIGTDRNSSFLRGPAKAPAVIRQALHVPSADSASESGADIFTDLGLTEGFDVKIAEDIADVAQIQAAIAGTLAAGAKPISLGGDHSITFPILQAFGILGIKPHIVHFGAHSDLYDDFAGNFYSHASPFARIMEAGLARGLTQIGIRTANRHQREQAARFGVTNVVGADLVELNPDRDINGMTAMVAAKIVKELVELLAR